MDHELKALFKALLTKTAKDIDRISFEQEPNYTAAFFGKMHNEELTSSSGQKLKLTFSVSNDRGPGSAEKKTGIDIGMVFKWINQENDDVIFEKAIFAQAKNRLLELSTHEEAALAAQCQLMKRHTNSYITLDCPYDSTPPKICQSSDTMPYWKNDSPIELGEYLCDIVFECKDGDQTQKVIEMAKRSNRTFTIETNAPHPEIAMRNTSKRHNRPSR